MANRQLIVEIVGDPSSLDKALGSVVKNSESSMAKVGKAATLAGAAIGAGFAVIAKVGFDELAESQKVMAQTGAVLKSTGEAAGVTAKQVESLAGNLSSMSGVDDEAIQAGENLLLTFTNIRNEVGKGNNVFDQATATILDMSVAMGTDMKSATIQVGKALNDPVKGISALSKVGVTFTDGQKKLIKSLVDSGDQMGAQKVILGELNKEFGGSAKAAGDTFPGQLNKAKNALAETAATVTAMLLPAMTKFADVTRRASVFLQEHETLAKALFVAMGALAGILLTVGAVTKVMAASQAVITAATSAWTAAQWLLNAALNANPIGIVVVALAALVAGLVLAYKSSETFRNIVDGAFRLVKNAAEAVLNFFRDNWKIIAALITGPFAPIVLLATDAFGIRSKLIAAGGAVLDFFRDNWKTIAVIISGPFAPLVALATDAFGIRSALVRAFGFIVDGVGEKVGALISLIAGLPGRIVRALGDLDRLLYNAGIQIVEGLISGITDKLGDLYGLVSGIGGKIASLKGPIEKDRGLLTPQGRAILEGLVAGMQQRLPDLNRFVSGIAPAIDVRGPNVGALSGFPLSAPTALATSSGGGAVVINLNVAGSVVTENELTDTIRRNLIQLGRRNGGDIFGGMA